MSAQVDVGEERIVVVDSPDYSAAIFCNHLLHKRLEIIMTALQAHPGCSLPQACRSRAALKAAYRFVDHPDTTVPHLQGQRTKKRPKC